MEAGQLMKQAMMTAHDYMYDARYEIDKMFGEGYAAKNPALVAAYMQTAALDYAASFGLDRISRSLDRIAENVNL